MLLRFHWLAFCTLLGILFFIDVSAKVQSTQPEKASKDPLIAKKSIEEWIDILRTGTEEERRQALLALKAQKSIPKTALPVLIGVVENDREPISVPALELIGRFGLEAKEYVPQLLRLMRETDKPLDKRILDQEIAATLTKIDTEARVEVTRLMLFLRFREKNRTQEFWDYAYRFPIPITEQLLELFAKEEKIRSQVLFYIGQYREPRVANRKPLFDLVEPEIRLLSRLESFLGQNGDWDHQLLDHRLIEALIYLDPQMGVDHSSFVIRALDKGRISYQWFIVNLRPKAKEMLPIIMHRLRTAPGLAYRYILAQWPPELVWSNLQSVLHHRHPEDRYTAIMTLSRFLTDLRSQSPSVEVLRVRKEIGNELEIAIGDEYPQVRLKALMALASHFPEKREQLVCPLVRMIGHRDQEIQWEAIQTLGRLGSTAYRALPTLLQLLPKLDNQTRAIALEAIVSIDISRSDRLTEELRQALKKTIGNPDRQRILRTIQKMGPKGKDLIKDVFEVLQELPMPIAMTAVDTLIKIAPDQSELITQAVGRVIQKIPQHKNADYQARIVTQRLLQMGAKASPVLPVIEELRPLLNSESLAIFSIGLFALDPKNREKYGSELRNVLLHRQEDVIDFFLETREYYPYLKDFMPVFSEVLKSNPHRVHFLVDIFEVIGLPMKEFLSELKAMEAHLQTSQQKAKWTEYLKNLEAMKK